MRDEKFRGDPYAELGLRHDASDGQVKRRWRELAREHHPDRAASSGADAAHLTRRMARINAAYDLLRDPGRRAAYDGSAAGRRARAESGAAARDGDAAGFPAGGGQHYGPPPPRPTAPVTARFDTTPAFRPPNARIDDRPRTRRMSGHGPYARHAAGERELRASTPTGPIERRRGERAIRLPTLEEARATELNFGKHHGRTLGEVEHIDPAYIDWIARTITRDRDMVIRARLIEAELDAAGASRPSHAAAAAEQ